jgi:K+-transporting ATPase ATPase C chain
MKNVWTALLVILVFTVVCGFVYPMLITGIAQVCFPKQANGSLVEKDGKVIGSRLIGQEFVGSEYFHGRPSNSGYNGSSSSNIALSNPELLARLEEQYNHARVSYGFEKDSDIPADLVTESASGLDPDITLEAALIQVNSVAKAREIETEKLTALVNSLAKQGIGYRFVNVLELNLALEEMNK